MNSNKSVTNYYYYYYYYYYGVTLQNLSIDVHGLGKMMACRIYSVDIYLFRKLAFTNK